MGCSSSRLTENELDSTQKVARDKEVYNLIHEKFEMLCADIMKDMRRDLDPHNKESCKKVLEMIKQQKKVVSIQEDELLQCLMEFTAQIYIEENNLQQDYEVYEISLEMIKETNLFSGNKLDLIKLLIENFSRLFPRTQKGVFLSITENECDISILDSIMTNFKFNLSFNLEVLSVVSNNFILKNFNLCQGLSEIIISNKNLINCLFHIFDEEKPISQEMLLNLNNVFSAIRRSNSIKFLLIQTMKDNLFDLTPEMERTILVLIQRDNLFGLYLGKFGMSDYFMYELAKSIADSKNLKFILIESKRANVNLLDDLIIHGIGRNRSITMAIMAGFNISESKANEYKQIQNHNEVLKVFEYTKEIL